MIDHLVVKNFKSIKEIEIDCRRINLFIGEPNTGKSNILEVFGLLNWCGNPTKPLNDYVRFESIQDLFYDALLDDKIEIVFKHKDHYSVEMEFRGDNFRIKSEMVNDITNQRKSKREQSINYNGEIIDGKRMAEFSFLKYYKFVKQNRFPDSDSSHLLAPHGSNLFTLVMGNRKIRDMMAGFFKNFNLTLVLKPRDRTFEIQKQRGDLVFSYPYISTSDTLQRIIFFTIAMESNQEVTLIFEEPESFAFPYYTKYLGERIAFNRSNQYFISTHNPYLLLSILEKAEKEAVKVFITYLQDDQTKVKPLTNEEISQLMDTDPFFNLNAFIEEEDR
jgi:hypothetical protein